MNGTSASFQSAIVRITETVSNYRDGLARIDREFDEAFDRIDRSIAGLHGDKTKHGKGAEKAQDQEKKLRQESSKIEHAITKADASKVFETAYKHCIIIMYKLQDEKDTSKGNLFVN